jgi:hypothetical protein
MVYTDPPGTPGTDPENSLVNDLDLTVQKVRGPMRGALQVPWFGIGREALPKDPDDSALWGFVRGRLS